MARCKCLIFQHWKAFILVFILLTVISVSLRHCASQAWKEARTMMCSSNLHGLSCCMFWYYDKHGYLPPAHYNASDGTRMHSWRVLVAVEEMGSDWPPVPYDYREPWNSPNNAKSGVYRPVALACPSDLDSQENHRLTNYFVIEGAKTPFPGSGTRSFADGEKASENRSNTILIAEATGLGVEWLEPRDLNYDTMSFTMNDSQRPSISSHHPSGCNVVMADGSYRTLNPAISPEVLKSMLNIRESDWRPGPEKPDIP